MAYSINKRALASGLAGAIIASPIAGEAYTNIPSSNNACIKAGTHIGISALNKQYTRSRLGAKSEVLYYPEKEFYELIKEFSPGKDLGTLEKLLQPKSQCMKDIRQIVQVISGLTVMPVVIEKPNEENPNKRYVLLGYVVIQPKK
jgi:hypothetical protein